VHREGKKKGETINGGREKNKPEVTTEAVTRS
jgi:hypothetical protein